MDIQDDLQTKYTSGTVFHVFLGEQPSSWESVATLVKKIASNYKLPYFTISPTYSICKEHGYIQGEHYTCPKCGAKTEVYSRITGYYRPVQNWNIGKTQEFKDRKTYNFGGAVNGTCYHDAAKAIEASSKAKVAGNLLFTTKTCPNCPTAKAALERNNIAYTVVDAQENSELANEYSVMSVPTFFVDGDKNQVLSGAGAIVSWANKHA